MSTETFGFNRLSYFENLDREKLGIFLNHAPVRRGIIKRTGFIKDIADVFIGDVPIISVYGVADISDEELETIEVYVWGEFPDIKLCLYKPNQNTITPTLNERRSFKVKNLPNQNYLALRKSRY